MRIFMIRTMLIMSAISFGSEAKVSPNQNLRCSLKRIGGAGEGVLESATAVVTLGGVTEGGHFQLALEKSEASASLDLQPGYQKPNGFHPPEYLITVLERSEHNSTYVTLPYRPDSSVEFKVSLAEPTKPLGAEYEFSCQ